MNPTSNRRAGADREGRPRTEGGRTEGGIVIGLRSAGGAVLAADARTSRGSIVASETARKIATVHPSAAIGSVADLDRSREFVAGIRAEVDRYEDRHDRPMGVPALATVAGRDLRSGSSSDDRFVLAGVDDAGAHAFAIDAEGGVLETDAAAEGSGREAAYGVLDGEDVESLSLEEARALAARAIESAAARDPRTGAAVRLATITDRGVDIERFDAPDDVGSADADS